MTAMVLAWPTLATKQCRTCSQHLPLDQFYASRQNRDGRISQCKECHSRACAKRYADNPEPVKRRSKEWREADPERYRTVKAENYRRNREARQAKNRQWAKENAERKRAADKAWREANIDRKRTTDKAWQAANLSRKQATARDGHLRRKYGISLSQYNEMLASQDGRCGVCRTTEPDGGYGRPFAVDHDHKTGVVRGLLCIACNTGIGFFRDSPGRLRQAIGYLTKGVQPDPKETQK